MLSLPMLNALRRRRLMKPWALAGGAPLANQLVNGYSSNGDGFAAVFEEAPSIYVKNSADENDYTALTLRKDGIDDFSAFFTRTNGFVKNVMQADGTIKYAAHNLATSSQVFVTGWQKTGVETADNAALAPDGTTTASFAKEDTSTADHSLEQGITLQGLSRVTYSIYAKGPTQTAATYSFAHTLMGVAMRGQILI